MLTPDANGKVVSNSAGVGSFILDAAEATATATTTTTTASPTAEGLTSVPAEPATEPTSTENPLPTTLCTPSPLPDTAAPAPQAIVSTESDTPAVSPPASTTTNPVAVIPVTPNPNQAQVTVTETVKTTATARWCGVKAFNLASVLIKLQASRRAFRHFVKVSFYYGVHICTVTGENHIILSIDSTVPVSVVSA